MKASLRAILADVKAAVRLGHPEAVQASLQGLRRLPEVAGNGTLPDNFLEHTILPLGQALSASSLPMETLRPLLDDPLAGVRAVGAAVLGLRVFRKPGLPSQELLRPARDPRSEVRHTLALAMSLGEGGGSEPQRLLNLVKPWLKDPAPRLRHTALLAVGAAAAPLAGLGAAVIEKLEPLHTEEDTEVRLALVEALSALAGAGLATEALDLLERWTSEPQPEGWLIARTLSASWAAGQSARALRILDNLEAKLGPGSQISNARRAIDRNQN